eukprot:scaffold14068_cov119-Isochrysis_galbana.AAC.13
MLPSLTSPARRAMIRTSVGRSSSPRSRARASRCCELAPGAMEAMLPSVSKRGSNSVTPICPSPQASRCATAHGRAGSASLTKGVTSIHSSCAQKLKLSVRRKAMPWLGNATPWLVASSTASMDSRHRARAWAIGTELAPSAGPSHEPQEAPAGPPTGEGPKTMAESRLAATQGAGLSAKAQQTEGGWREA